MSFLDAFDRVLYDKNPLESVICQVRFPTILRIDSELPSAFQDRIRENFPLFEPAKEEAAIPSEMAQLLLGRSLEGLPGRNYSFLSEDRIWQVSLTRDFLALTCSDYKRWEEFQHKFDIPLLALMQEYKPSFYSRLGLRYRNTIRRSVLGLSEVSWGKLLNARIAGELNDEEVAKYIKNVKKEILLEFPDSAQARMVQGFTKVNEEEGYVIDTDVFTTQKTEASNVGERLGTFNKLARWVFRWSISDDLHDAMRPRRI